MNNILENKLEHKKKMLIKKAIRKVAKSSKSSEAASTKSSTKSSPTGFHVPRSKYQAHQGKQEMARRKNLKRFEENYVR